MATICLVDGCINLANQGSYCESHAFLESLGPPSDPPDLPNPDLSWLSPPDAPTEHTPEKIPENSLENSSEVGNSLRSALKADPLKNRASKKSVRFGGEPGSLAHMDHGKVESAKETRAKNKQRFATLSAPLTASTIKQMQYEENDKNEAICIAEGCDKPAVTISRRYCATHAKLTVVRRQGHTRDPSDGIPPPPPPIEQPSQSLTETLPAKRISSRKNMSSATLRRCVVAGCKKFSVSRNHCAEHARAAARRNSSEDMSTLDRELGTPRLTVIAKMIAEEREYIQAINYLIVNLIQPLRDAASAEQAIVHNGFNVPVLQLGDISAMIGNIEQMIPYQEKLLNDLETELNGSGLIGKAFVRFCPFLRMYPHFAQQYISLISVISSLCTSEESFFQFVKQFNQTCSVAHKKSLHDLLELPIYRPEQYSEVLKQLLRYTPEDHSDHGDLQRAISKAIDTTAESRHHMLRQYEENMKNVSNILSGFTSSSPNRFLIREENMTKISRNGKKPYRFFLFNDALVYGTQMFASNMTKHHGTLDLVSCMVRDLMDGTLGSGSFSSIYLSKNSSVNLSLIFEINSPSKSLVVQAPSQHVKHVWIFELNRLISKVQGTSTPSDSAVSSIVSSIVTTQTENTKKGHHSRTFSSLDQSEHQKLVNELLGPKSTVGIANTPTVNVPKIASQSKVEDPPTASISQSTQSKSGNFSGKLGKGRPVSHAATLRRCAQSGCKQFAMGGRGLASRYCVQHVQQDESSTSHKSVSFQLANKDPPIRSDTVVADSLAQTKVEDPPNRAKSPNGTKSPVQSKKKPMGTMRRCKTAGCKRFATQGYYCRQHTGAQESITTSEDHADPDDNASPVSPICVAAEENDLNGVKMALRGASSEDIDASLMSSLAFGYSSISEFLSERTGNLMLAAWAGNARRVEELLKCGSYSHEDKVKGLQEAVRENHLEVIRILAVAVQEGTQATDAPKEDRSEILREKAINELRDTERSYVMFLRSLISAYIQPMKSKESKSWMSTLLHRPEISGLFSNIQELVPFQEQFLSTLEGSGSNDSVGRIFLDFSPFLKMYALYAQQQGPALSAIFSASKSTPKLNAFLKTCSQDPSSQGQSLPSLLIMPVQRIPRYKLLLQEIIKHTADTHPDKHHLQQALGKVGGAALHMNEAMLQHENHQKILDIQNSFSGHLKLFAEGRMFVREGILTKITRKGPKEYRFVLFSDILVYGTPMFASSLTKHRATLDLRLCSIKDLRGNEGGDAALARGATDILTTFEIHTPKKPVVIQAASFAQKQEWVKDIKRFISESIKGDGERKPLNRTNSDLAAVNHAEMAALLAQSDSMSQKPRTSSKSSEDGSNSSKSLTFNPLRKEIPEVWRSRGVVTRSVKELPADIELHEDTEEESENSGADSNPTNVQSMQSTTNLGESAPNRNVPVSQPPLPIATNVAPESSLTPNTSTDATQSSKPTTEENASESLCGRCNGPILDRKLRAINKLWHADCFSCFYCQTPLSSGQQFFAHANLPYCQQHYRELFCPRCISCKEPIDGPALAALGQKWHPSCFVCAHCQQPFESGVFFKHDGRPYCEAHHKELFCDRCASCGDFITGKKVMALGMSYHPEHLVCAVCACSFQDNVIYVREGQPVCETHALVDAFE